MKPNLTPTVLAIALAMLCINSRNTFAGDREWATAGKILTGIVAANFIGDVVHKKSHRRTERVVYNQPKRSYGYDHNHRKRGQRYNNGRDYRDNYRKPRKQYYRGYRNHKIKKYNKYEYCDDSVIVVIERGRRIMQPRIHGATAYLQVYSNTCDNWVTIDEYPSIW